VDRKKNVYRRRVSRSVGGGVLFYVQNTAVYDGNSIEQYFTHILYVYRGIYKRRACSSRSSCVGGSFIL
jgi:hypothetical protein